MKQTRSTALQLENDSLRQEFARLEELEQQLALLAEANLQMRLLAGLEADTSMWSGESALSQASEPHQRGLPGIAGRGPWKPSVPGIAPHSGPVSRGYEPERSSHSSHLGVDIPGPVGALVLASGGGIVRHAGRDSIFGMMVILDHGDGLRSLYGHNSSVLVELGDSVRAGEVIARLGNTGRSSAPHLHFEVLKDGVPMDPGNYVREYRSSGKNEVDTRVSP